MTSVERFDVSELGKPHRTPQGFLRVPAFVTRAGVLEYRRADGTVVRELRSPDEVFKADSLSTLRGAPVTDLHPKEMVTPKNVRELSVGRVGEVSRRDGHLVAAEITVEHEDEITAVERRERCEVSMGYRCRIDATPGTFEGAAYDVIQRDIVYNHAALLPRGGGRAGRDVALRLDASSAVSDPFPFTEQRTDQGDPPMETITIRVDGLDVQVPKQWAQVIEKGLKTREDATAAAVKERDALQARVDAMTAERDALKGKLDTASDPKRLDAAVTERVALVSRARKVLPAETKLDGLTTRAVHELVLKQLDDKLDLTGKSDEYVSARFDAETERLPEQRGDSERNDALAAARTAGAPPGVTPPAPPAAPAAYVPDWQRPLAIKG